MKCSKCGNEYDNENFCPVCGYPSEDIVKKRTQAEKYASQFGDNFEEMDTEEETDRIVNRATQAQQYESQFSSDYSQLFNEYAKDADKKLKESSSDNNLSSSSGKNAENVLQAF